MEKEKEVRKIIIETIEVRATDTGAKVIEGYITKFNTRSQYMGFFETVAPTAFDKTLADGHNIFAMYNHNDDKILGSTRTSSLVLTTDNIGLRFSLTINSNVSYANDTYEMVKSGDIDGCSFGFIMNEDDWTMQGDGTDLRTLLDITLVECTITPFPAYLDSQASCRSFTEHNEALEERNQAKEQALVLELIQIEMEL